MHGPHRNLSLSNVVIGHPLLRDFPRSSSLTDTQRLIDETGVVVALYDSNLRIAN